MDVTEECFSVAARCLIVSDETVVDGSMGAFDDGEALVVYQTPLGGDLAAFVDGVLFDET
jgi:hypothetical protein